MESQLYARHWENVVNKTLEDPIVMEHALQPKETSDHKQGYNVF